MNEQENVLLEDVISEEFESDFDFDEFEKELEAGVEEWKFLKDEKEKINNVDELGKVVMDTIWDQFIIQMGAVAGEEFIKENRGLKLDLRDEVHIQTAENFAKGKIATHNYISSDQLKRNYDRYKNKPHKEFRDEFVDPGMDATLQRAGKLYEQGIETVTDIYTGKQIPTKTKLENGKNNPQAAQREHVKSSNELYSDPSLQMANSDQELASIINDPENLQGYTTAKRNNSKSDKSASEMDDADKTKLWEKANKKAEEFVEKKKKEGEQRLIEEGKKTQKEEALRMGGKALQATLMALLMGLVKEIIGKLIHWLKSESKSLNTFIEEVKAAIAEFFINIKQRILSAGMSVGTSVLTAIYGPIVSTIQRVWSLIKQGGRSVKEAIDYIKKPENRNQSYEVLMLEVGKILITGTVGVGGVFLSEAIEKVLLPVPGFGIPIPIIGTMANVIGMFLGGLIAGVVGAFLLNQIDKIIAKKKKNDLTVQQIDKGNEILKAQKELTDVLIIKKDETKKKSADSIKKRHEEAASYIKGVVENMSQDIVVDHTIDFEEIDSVLVDLLS